MDGLVQVAGRVVLTLGGQDVTLAELLGFVTGAWCVWLTVKERVGNFPVGIANSAFFLLLFWDARLYANAALQVVYIALGAIGWRLWLRGGAERGRLLLDRLPRRHWLTAAAATATLTAVLTLVLREAGDAAPFWDALTTALSLVAQWLLNTKRLENWYVWAVADLIYVPLYLTQRLYLTSVVYVLFLALCVAGLIEWRRRLRALPPRPGAAGGGAGMTRFRHGLVVGKFYPPHAGHRFLIRSAAAFCDRVTVAVLASSVESVPLDVRVAWLREEFHDQPHVHVEGALDDHPIDYDDPAVWDLHDAVIDEVLGGAAVDATFASEPYGAELARRRGAANVCLDVARGTFPVSGTAVRTDPAAHWQHLAPAVRGHLAKRVVVVGAESTGTTTLSRDLAAALRSRGGPYDATWWVPEYGREYSLAKLAVARAAAPCGLADLTWAPEEFAAVARQQCRDEDAAARAGGPVLVCDTDALATVVWEERYVGRSSAAVRAIAAAMPPRTLYVLTGDEDVPFEDDGLRDGEHLRGWMTGRFREVLDAGDVPWVEVKGPPDERLRQALATVDGHLARGWAFTDPLG
jgi:NadR type nicotinamide-nucleotide adenylyltransferase